MVDPLKVLWVLTNSTYLVSKLLKAGVSDSNDVPYFEKSLYQIEVEENEKLHKSFTKVTSENHNGGSNIRYEISSGNLGGVFEIDPSTGEVSLAADLDYEAKKLYELRISASVGGSIAYTSLQVRVLDVNDNPPVFEKPTYNATVQEEETTGLPKKILKVNVTDADNDRPMDIVYSLTGPGVDTDDPSGGKFFIDKSSGDVYVLKPLDRDLPQGRPQWKFTVFAQDEKGEGLVGYADILVNLRDVNDNAPVFLQNLFTANVTENGTAGLEVVRVVAEDLDDISEEGNAKIVYSIEKNVLDEETGTPIFSVDPDSGMIKTTVCCLDREKTAEYSLRVVATDGGGLKGTGTVSIAVMDINDMPPLFTKEEWITEVSESQDSKDLGQALLTVTVVDQDENNDFYYSVVGGSGYGTELFMMIRNPDNTGSLKVIKPLDFEDPLQRDGFRFKIQGPNSTDSFHVAYSWVVLHLRDINDNDPQFDKSSSSVALPEDAEVGTLVDTFWAKDPDGGGQGAVSFRIERDSDVRRHFNISADGKVTVQRPLDRETTPIHKLKITATDEGVPPRSATATLFVTLVDMNDHAPELLQDYHPILRENSLPRVILEVAAKDADDPARGNGPPFTFWLDPVVNDTLGLLFSVITEPTKDDGRGVGVVSSLTTFNREVQKEYHVPIIIQDSGDPVMSGTSTLTVIIGDVNDHSMAAGSADIQVYKLQGVEEQSTNVGQVYVEDEDDWDVLDKTFFWESTPDPMFTLNQDTGSLRMAADTLPGVYRMMFRVQESRHVQQSVVSNVTVAVSEITMRDVQHSTTITFMGVTDTGFIKRMSSSTSKLEEFQKIVALILSTKKENVKIFSIKLKHKFSPQTNVRFFVKEDSQYFKPVRLEGILLMHRSQVEIAMSLNVTAVGPSECLDELQCVSDCTESVSLSSTYHIVNGNSTVLVGPSLLVTSECVCAAREFNVRESCESYPCLNGGTCQDTSSGPTCSCSEYHEGPRCQQTSRGFGGRGWAWYPGLRACTPTHLSLEFLTDKSDGLLLYNGPVGPPNPNAALVKDFIALELVEGRVRGLLDLGSGTVTLSVPARLDDGEWHRVDVLWNSDEVELIIDYCQSQNVTELHDKDVSEVDQSQCLTKTSLPLFDYQLNVNTPLQVGGWHVHELNATDYSWSEAPRGTSLDGCVRNIMYNGEIVDLASPVFSQDSMAGCSHTAALCRVRRCAPGGVCDASLHTSRCHCLPGHSGPSCASPTVPSSLHPGALVKFTLNFDPDRFSTALQLRFRTREPDGELLRLMDQYLREYLVLEVRRRALQVRVNLNSLRPREEVVSLISVTVDDGRWHFAEVRRHGSAVTLQLDGGDGRRYNESFRFRGHQMMFVDKQEGVYAGGPTELVAEKSKLVVTSFQGCLDDIRLDGKLLPLPPGSNSSQWGQAPVSRAVESHCHSSNACQDVRCPDTFVCEDIWNDFVCSCGDGRRLTADGRGCESRTECLENPCLNKGFCIPHSSRTGFHCECPEGFWGPRCEVLQERQAMRLGITALFTIVGCLLLILLVVALLVAYHRRRESPPMKRPATDDDVRENIISYKHMLVVALFVAYHRRRESPPMKRPATDDDVRENIISYNDEGGGADDLNAFDLLPLNVPLTDLVLENKNKLRVPELIERIDLDTLESRIEAYKKRADMDYTAPPYDDLRCYAYEGDCDSVADSLSSLDSALDVDGSTTQTVLGPRFNRLVHIYTTKFNPSSKVEAHLEASV